MEKFLLIFRINSHVSILGEADQEVAGPMRQAGDIQDEAPIFTATTGISDGEQDGWVQTTNTSVGHRGQDGLKEVVRFGWEGESFRWK